MKHTLAIFGMAGLAAMLFSSTALAQKGNEVKETKKTRHIKLAKIENGKKMELDTVITGDDVFVWKGDTIGGKDMGEHLSSSDVGKMKHMEVMVDGDENDENVMIYHKKHGKSGDPMMIHMESGDDEEMFNEQVVDSVQKRIIIRKRLKDGAEDQFIYLNEPNMKQFPPIPPLPPMPHSKMLRGGQHGRVINLNDPNIISYKKKELSGGREKIEIVRKKSEGPENMSFDFQFDDQLMPPPPPPPPAPEMTREFNDDNQKMKVTEKDVKVNGKDGKEIKVEVETKENK